MVAIEEKQGALSRLNAGVSACHACPLGSQRTRAVPGEGPVDAELMLVGEAPGYYEDQQGRPFVGAAGQFLEQLLGSIGLKRNEVFIGNVIMPAARQPRSAARGDKLCAHWLSEQFEIIHPRVIVTLAATSWRASCPACPSARCTARAQAQRYLDRPHVPPGGRPAPGLAAQDH
jgi:DNA polymerase